MGYNFHVVKGSAIAQIILGSLLVTLGIVERVITRSRYGAFPTEAVTPIWMGMWIIITGAIGILVSSRTYTDNDRPSTALIGTYLGFSVVSAVFAGIIIILYSLGLIFGISFTLGLMIILFAILEFAFGIFACVCSCMNGGCGQCTQQQTPQMGQVIYIQTPEGPKAHIMAQGADGVPVAIPVAVPVQDISPPPYTARAAGGGAGQGTLSKVGYANSDVV